MIIPSSQLEAIAVIKGEGQLWGTAKFYTVPGGLLMVTEVSGLPETESGFLALHIHEGKSCAGEGFGETKGHYNPTGQPHPEHTGDLPPLLNVGGRALLAVETDRFFLEEIIGRTVVIHGGPDDLHSQPAGNAGQKIACGVIRWAEK